MQTRSVRRERQKEKIDGSDAVGRETSPEGKAGEEKQRRNKGGKKQSVWLASPLKRT